MPVPKKLDFGEKADFVATDHVSHLPFPTANMDIKAKTFSLTDSSQCTADETKDETATTTSNSSVDEVLRLKVYDQAEGLQGLQLNDGTTLNTAGAPSAEDLDASSTEDTDSLLYRSQFGQWDSSAAPVEAPLEEQSPIGTGQDISNDNCDGSFDGLMQQPNSNDVLPGRADIGGISSSTFKTWNSTAKEWGNHWTHDETEDSVSVHSDKFFDNGSSDV